MKKFFALLLLFISFTALAAPADLPMAPPPQLAAKAWLLLDTQSGQALAEHNADQRIEPASLTKLMSAYLSFAALRQGRIKLTDTLPVSEKAWKAEGSRMFIEPNKPVTVAELLRGMIVQSGNDATIALAETIGGSEAGFVTMMNKQAQRLGMSNTHFVNSTGLPDPQHYTTARDLARLAAAIVRDFPEFYPLYSIKEYTYNGITQANRNRLLWTDPTVDGMKTGHTQNAGYCLIASARRGERRLLSVVLDTDADAVRAMESQRLLNYGFQFFDSVRLYAKNQTVAKLKVWKGASNTIKTGFTRDVYLSLPRGQARDIKASLTTRQPLLAPLVAGQQVGTVTLTLNNKPLAQYPLLALESVGVANLFGRAWDGLRLIFK
ncbi:peptidase [Sulfuriferula plumbiphila]|uniref:serine-type D-Ala-D-Ala carboxypeptidase n=1 Tax=Sulfuriferula plumbiphila TaxID=171865 RepID=A0A512L3D7_9PROT|nr:D-alanyl-D-alanine carboxypeptidase family protein [Sulfuriferula plumbiphila]BBP02694.1 peptidase [Sulfuriferula plumbiphila]GEP28988.1 peptidase [Sulfuriferula plumbiphila]